MNDTTTVTLKLIFVLIALTLASCSSSTQSTAPRVLISNDVLPKVAVIPKTILQSKIDTLLNDSTLAPCFIGLKVVSLDNGNVLYERDSRKLFHPASNMKLLTAATGLHMLGRDFQYTTHLYSDAQPAHGVIEGNIYVKGTGDPLLTTDDLDTIALALQEHGITSIRGDLVGDVSFFDSLYWGAGWMWDDEPDPDEAFITPLTVNDNSIELTVNAGNRVGDPTHIDIHPATSFMDVINVSVTSNDTLLPPLSVKRLNRKNTIVVQGRISPRSIPRQFPLSVWQPEMYFLDLLKSRLLDHGIALKGTARIGSTEGSNQLATRIHTIDSVLYSMNKRSDNIAAENLLKTIAAKRKGTPGSAAQGIEVMKEYLASIGIDTSAMILRDGSGVSWYNALSTDEIVTLLAKQYKDNQTFTTFYESLPIAGVDGTLEHRMMGTHAVKNVHAKTGTLTGNSALSGYVTSLDGKLLGFSMLCNHFPGKMNVLRDVQDKILELLANASLTQK
jgi:D-alanyl-D-alanine carboxypeptidase/D-alanyl-D-alanine-endopeptidase (penicillin-binding protein 4)